LLFVPIALGIVLGNTNPEVVEQLKLARDQLASQGLTSPEIASRISEMKAAGQIANYDYATTWLIFVGLAMAAVVLGVFLKVLDKRKGYGLELPNIQK
jgi:hypothetical protein